MDDKKEKTITYNDVIRSDKVLIKANYKNPGVPLTMEGIKEGIKNMTKELEIPK